MTIRLPIPRLPKSGRAAHHTVVAGERPGTTTWGCVAARGFALATVVIVIVHIPAFG